MHSLDWYGRRTYYDFITNRIIIWYEREKEAAKKIWRAYKRYRERIKHRPIR